MPNQFTTSLWGDEAFSAVLSVKPIPEIIKIITRDTSPPLYNITEHLWFKVFGTSEIAIRSLSFLFFLIAVFFVYKIGTYLWHKKAGLVAALLTFLNPFFFIYAFEGRMYSLLAATITASMYFFLIQNWTGYVLATVAALYSHHFAIFALLVQGLWFLTKPNKKAFRSFLLVGLLYLPWLLPLYNQTRMVVSGFWLGTPTFTDLRNLVYKFLAEGLPGKLAQPALYLSFVTLLLRRWHKGFRKSLFLLSWFFIPILVTFVFSQKFQSIFFDRYLLYTIPAAMLILASCTRKFSSFLIGVLLILFALIDFNYFTHPTKRPFRELSNFVKQTRQVDDALINWNASAHHLWESKYYQIPAPLYIPKGHSLPFYVGTALMSQDDIISSPPQTRRIGVITSGPVAEVSLPGYNSMSLESFGELKFIWLVKK